MRNHLDLKAAYFYLKTALYPDSVSGKNEKANFRRQIKPYFLQNGQLFYRKCPGAKCLQVIADRKDQLRLISLTHEGDAKCLEASALGAHRGRDAVRDVLAQNYYWPGMNSDIAEYIRTCLSCQRANTATLKVVPEMQPVAVPPAVFKQIGIDICKLPRSDDGYEYVVMAIDYFSKWSEAEKLKDKSARSVAEFIYKLICRHGCHKVQINDQGREFVNKVSEEVHRLTGTKQRIASAYHPQVSIPDYPHKGGIPLHHVHSNTSIRSTNMEVKKCELYRLYIRDFASRKMSH